MGVNEIAINSLSELQLIQLAKKSSDVELLHRLSQSSYPTVRRCVARSRNTSRKTIDTLACDSALNVSFIANNNPNCTIKKVKIVNIHVLFVMWMKKNIFQDVILVKT